MFTISITKFFAISICGFYKNRANSREPKKKVNHVNMIQIFFYKFHILIKFEICSGTETRAVLKHIVLST